MRPCKLKLNEKQKRFVFLIEFFLMDKIYFCKIGNFLTKMFSVMLRTLFPVISVLLPQRGSFVMVKENFETKNV